MTMEELIKPFEDTYDDYLGDESKMKGAAVSISFPKTKEDVVKILQFLSPSAMPITIQGAKTGICGGAVPMAGHIMNLENMNNIIDYQEEGGKHYITVQPGITLEELKKHLYKRNLFWPPEPTETSATVGGVIATNAQGIDRYLYGDTHHYVENISYVDHEGEIFTLKRGERKFNHNECLLPSKKVLTVNTNALGIMEDHDLIDLFIGSEGMFGVIVEATLKVIKRPKEIWDIVFFFETQENLFQFAEKVKNIHHEEGTASVAAIEYIDKRTLKYIQELKQVATKLKDLPDIDENTIGIIYLEISGDIEGDIEKIAEEFMELAIEFGGDPDVTWAVSEENEIEKIRAFRHAAPESINVAVERAKLLDARITKLGTDITHEGKAFKDLIEMYQEDANNEGLEIAIFGHLGDNHLHVNILPKHYEDYCKGKDIIEKWSMEAAKKNGKIFTEHGIGKIKKELFQRITHERILNELKSLKKQLDPQGIWNPSNMFDSLEQE